MARQARTPSRSEDNVGGRRHKPWPSRATGRACNKERTGGIWRDGHNTQSQRLATAEAQHWQPRSVQRHTRGGRPVPLPLQTLRGARRLKTPPRPCKCHEAARYAHMREAVRANAITIAISRRHADHVAHRWLGCSVRVGSSVSGRSPHPTHATSPTPATRHRRR